MTESNSAISVTYESKNRVQIPSDIRKKHFFSYLLKKVLRVVQTF